MCVCLCVCVCVCACVCGRVCPTFLIVQQMTPVLLTSVCVCCNNLFFLCLFPPLAVGVIFVCFLHLSKLSLISPLSGMKSVALLAVFNVQISLFVMANMAGLLHIELLYQHSIWLLVLNKEALKAFFVLTAVLEKSSELENIDIYFISLLQGGLPLITTSLNPLNLNFIILLDINYIILLHYTV